MTDPDYFHLGSEAETVAAELETYEQLAKEAAVVDLTDPQCDE